MLINREVITVKVESAYNTDATPAATDAVLVEDPSWSNEGLRINERNPVKPTFGREQSVYGGHLRTVTFSAEIKGSGAAGTAPEVGGLMRGCGFGETITPATSVVYAPVSTGIESVTIYYYQDGLLRKITGARGSVSFTLEAGSRVMASFTFTGHDAGTTDVALVTPTYDSTLPPVVVSAPFTFGGDSDIISSLEFDMANNVSMPADISASDGYGEIRITQRRPTGSMNPEAGLIATKNWETILSGSTQSALATGAIGGTAGNIVQFSMPSVGVVDLAPGDKEMVRVYDTSIEINESSGDDEVSISFT
jgi:hypothetical protein